MDAHELLRTLSTRLHSFHASTLFLNGPVGSGKSYLLRDLALQVVRSPFRVQVIGPFEVADKSLDDLGFHILVECHQSGFLDGPESSMPRLSFVDSWKWLEANAHVNGEQKFVVLMDLSSSVQSDVRAIGNVFSQMRLVEGVWDCRSIQPHLVATGGWDHVQLQSHFNDLNVSFPYTAGYNYVVWNGVSAEEMVKIIAGSKQHADFEILGKTLHELVGGHPGAARDVIQHAMSKPMSLRTLLAAVQAAASDGDQSRRFLQQWQKLPANAQTLLSELVLRRHFVVSSSSESVDSLVISGSARTYRIGHRTILGFASWYAELVVRLHTTELGITDCAGGNDISNELMPETSVLNQEAYRLINDIENQARNFVSLQARLRQPTHDNQPLLRNLALRYDDRTRRTEDAHERSQAWKTRSAYAGLPVELNPLISYCSTRDLASIITDLARELKSSSWTQVAEAINELSGIRDAVMHNQLIDIDELEKLRDLQIAITDALSEGVL